MSETEHPRYRSAQTPSTQGLKPGKRLKRSKFGSFMLLWTLWHANPVSSNPFTLKAAAGTDNDIDIYVHRWLPSAPAKAVIQVIHGLAEHAGRYSRLAAALIDLGYAVYASDLRGHGKTATCQEDLGFFAAKDGWRKCLDDLWRVNRNAASAHPGLPIVLLGHSMGATLARQFIAEHGDSLSSVVLSGSSGQPNALAQSGRLTAQAGVSATWSARQEQADSVTYL